MLGKRNIKTNSSKGIFVHFSLCRQVVCVNLLKSFGFIYYTTLILHAQVTQTEHDFIECL